MYTCPKTPYDLCCACSHRIFNKRFLLDYLGWMLAPIPFMVPFGVVMALSPPWFKGLLQTPYSSAKTPLLRLALRLLLRNTTLFVCSYFPAFFLFKYVQRNRRELKYNPKTPTPSFMSSEALQSYSGIVVLTLYQTLLARVKGSQGPCTPRPLLWTPVIALWSDFHFYAAHRLLHATPLYERYHRLHHKSHDVDPFSGLSMHTVEHIVYFSAILPCLLPFVPTPVLQSLSDGLVVYPIPAHIGLWPFERHHWQHHAEFNYNYGSSQLFDELLGTTFEAYVQRKKSYASTKDDNARQIEAQRQRDLAMLGNE